MLPDSLPLNSPGWAAGVAAELEATLAHEPVEARLQLEWLPMANLRSGAVVARRAQLCWAHPRLGLLARSDFLDAARRSGTLARLDTWALHEAIEHLARTGPAGRLAVPVEVPVAPETLQQPYLAERLRGRCQAAGVDPGLVRVVVGEDCDASGDEEGVGCGASLGPCLQALAQAGLGIVLADPARSRLALGGLLDLPVAAMSLSMAWLRAQVCEEVGGGARLRALMRVARALGGDVQALGADLPSDLAVLRAARVDAAQGRAVPIARGRAPDPLTI